MSKCQQLLNYANTYRNMYIRYHASNMVLHSCSDVAYLVAPKARSCIAPYNYLSNHPSKTRKPTLNWPILIECKILRKVVSSAVEAETKGLCHAAQSSITIRTFLLNLGHPQPSTLLKTDDSTAIFFVHQNIQQKKSKSWDMQFHWLRDISSTSFENLGKPTL